MHELGRGRARGRARMPGSEAVSAELHSGLHPMNREIVTRAGNKGYVLNPPEPPRSLSLYKNKNKKKKKFERRDDVALR